jgi:hypothetical protein
VIEPLAPGQADTVSFLDWEVLERNALDVRCVGGGAHDTYIQNNICETSAEVTLSDFEVLEILAPRGVIEPSVAVTPGVILLNNGTSTGTVSVDFAVGSGYTDTKSISLNPGEAGQLMFADWIPVATGVCSTSCEITTPDERLCNSVLRGEVLVYDGTGIEGGSVTPAVAVLHPPVPNPFASTASVVFQLSQSGTVRLDVFDLTGRLVKTLVNSAMVAGMYSAVLDGEDMSSGIYFIRLSGSAQTLTTRVVLMR